MIEIPVLIIGGGPAGLTLALALSRKEIRSMLVEQATTVRTDLPPAAAPVALGSIWEDPNVTMRTGWRLFGFERFANGVTAHVMEVEGERQQQVRAQILVGCDGAPSLVRNFLDIDLDGPPSVSVVAALGRGRVMLAGDAAPPRGPGSRAGLDAAVADALGLAEVLTEWFADPGGPDLLQDYAAVRSAQPDAIHQSCRGHMR